MLHFKPENVNINTATSLMNKVLNCLALAHHGWCTEVYVVVIPCALMVCLIYTPSALGLQLYKAGKP